METSNRKKMANYKKLHEAQQKIEREAKLKTEKNILEIEYKIQELQRQLYVLKESGSANEKSM